MALGLGPESGLDAGWGVGFGYAWAGWEQASLGVETQSGFWLGLGLGLRQAWDAELGLSWDRGSVWARDFTWDQGSV